MPAARVDTLPSEQPPHPDSDCGSSVGQVYQRLIHSLSFNQRWLTGGSSIGTPYQRLLHSLHHDQRWLTEVNLGKRVGFYRFRGDLGSGNFSQVKMAVHQLTKERVAVKILDKSKLDQKTRKMLTREISTMEAIHHPNIIRLYEVVETFGKIHLVMEYANGGELFNRITTSGKIPEMEAKQIFAQVVSAVHYMHDHDFIHRDIKAENVFYAGPLLVKLGDFGFSTQLSSGSGQHLNTFCGSPPYAAPELFRDESYLGAPVDIWALGVLLYFMVTAQMPFRSQTVAALKKHILEGTFTIPGHVSFQCRKLIEGILKQVPKERLSLAEIRESSWMKGTAFPPDPGDAEAFCLVPSPPQEQEQEDLVSSVEVTARKKLADLGITDTMLAEHRNRGARSAIIGTYRIVVHRVQRRGNAAAGGFSSSSSADDLDAATSAPATPATAATTPTSNNVFFTLPFGKKRSKSGVQKARADKNNRSRTCVIL